MEIFKTPAAFDRTPIMGNGGTGKTWRARGLAERLQHPVVHLDDIHWEPGYGPHSWTACREYTRLQMGKSLLPA